MRGIRLPRTSGRAAGNSFAKLLHHVDPDASSGFGFEGKIMRPGSTVTEAELWPGGYPATPILLEYAAPAALYQSRGHNRNDQLYVLWKFDREANAWMELARARSASWEWALDLRPIALRALAASRSGVTVLPNLVVIAERISGFLDGELKPLEVPDRQKVLAVIHDQFAGLVARELLSHGP